MKCIELNGTLYECQKDLAEFLEWVRLEGIRVKVYRFLSPKPLTGYIKRRPRRRQHGEAARPLVVYNCRSEVGRWLDEDIITEIRYSNKALGVDPIWTQKGGTQIEYERPIMQIGDVK